MTGIVAIAAMSMFGLFGFLGFLAFLAYSNNSKNLKNNYLVNENHSSCCEVNEQGEERKSCNNIVSENSVTNEEQSKNLKVERVVHCSGIGKRKR